MESDLVVDEKKILNEENQPIKDEAKEWTNERKQVWISFRRLLRIFTLVAFVILSWQFCFPDRRRSQVNI
jgi:hypothetical protein